MGEEISNKTVAVIVIMCFLVTILIIAITNQSLMREIQKTESIKEIDDDDCDSSKDLLSNIDCNDVVFNEGRGVVYGNNTLIQTLCLEKIRSDMYCKLAKSSHYR